MNGKIDVSNYDLFLKKLQEALLSGRPCLVMDFSEVVMITSMGISAVMEAKNYANSHGVHFIVIGLKEKIRQVFELTGILNYFHVYKTLQDITFPVPSEHSHL